LATKENKFDTNVEGYFYVDKECIDCENCQQEAPEFFSRDETGEHSFVFKQPQDEAGLAKCMTALGGCPVDAIGQDGVMDFIIFVFLFVFGISVGTLGTLIGVGSGWIHVPFLMILFGFSPQQAIGTSIGIIFLNTLAGSAIYGVEKKIDFYLGWRLLAAALPGALVGPFIVQTYTHVTFTLIFGAFLLFMAYYLAFVREKIILLSENIPAIETPLNPVKIEIGIIGSFIIGLLSNLIGIGGGIIHVPFLMMALNMQIHRAVATSHFILCGCSLVGSLMFSYFGNIKLDFVMAIGIGTILGAMIGARMSSSVQEKTLRRLLAVAIIAVGAQMLLSSILK